ncbi:MAG TPA: hypothetical protein VF453_09525 [Burkholderiaceae bacterium]
MVAAAGIASAVIGAGGAIVASNKQAGAANRATDLQGQIYQQNQANLAPYMAAGTPALSRLSDLLGTSGNTGASGYGSLTKPFTVQDYLNNQDPSYQWMQQQGQQALMSSAGAQNGVLSGAAMKDLLNFSQGLAANQYQAAYNRWTTNQGNTFQRLSNLAGLGENAAAGAGNMGVQSGANMANTITGAGNAAASGIVGASNAVSGGLNNMAGYYYLQHNTGNPLMSQGFYGNDSTGYTNAAPWTVGPSPDGGS